MTTINDKIKMEINSEQNEKNINYFLKINTKNNIEIDFEKDYSYLEKLLLIQNGLKTESDFNQDLNLVSEYLNNIFPESNFDPFLTSLYISKNIINNKNNKIKKDIYKDIDFFYQNPKKIKDNSTVSIIKNFKLIGYILCHIYDCLKKYNIENMEQLLENINNIVLKTKINIYDEYINLVNTKNNWKNDSAYKLFVNKNKNKYKLPCELILLLNYFKNVYNLKINYENLKLNENDFLLLSITLINLDIIFPKVNYIKLNLINFPFKKDINNHFFHLEKKSLKYTNKCIKYFFIENNKKFLCKERYFNKDVTGDEKSNSDEENEVGNKKENNYIPDLINDNININDIILKHKNILTSIIITFLCLQKFIIMNKIDLIINDYYTNEYQSLFEKYCFLNTSSSFHIINLILMKDDINNFKVDLNFLDYITTNKLLEFIYKNKLISQLQISFFSLEISYIHQAIYKLYYEQNNINKNEEIINYIEEPEMNYLNNIIQNFEKNLNVLFDIIVTKKNLSKLILCFDIPSIIINNQLYMLLILKFIINTLTLIDDDNCGLNILSIFSPNTILDKDKCPFLDDYFEEFEIYQKNNSLIEFNLQVQIYKIINIKKLVSSNIIILNIGDFDLISFEIFIDYIISYKFSSNSNLKQLSIGLLKSIINFNQNINLLISKLYSIKILSLLELNLSSNLLIESPKDYEQLISNLKYNWISSSKIILNEKSKKVIESNITLRKDIKYLEQNFIPGINREYKTTNISECYWLMKFLFVNKLNVMKKSVDKIIYGIFRYLNYEIKMKIIHN